MHHITNAIESSARLFGLDVFIEPSGREWGFLEFGHQRHGPGESEGWGLGFHFVVSPLPPPVTA
jgi:hypothetical protein